MSLSNIKETQWHTDTKRCSLGIPSYKTSYHAKKSNNCSNLVYGHLLSPGQRQSSTREITEFVSVCHIGGGLKSLSYTLPSHAVAWWVSCLQPHTAHLIYSLDNFNHVTLHQLNHQIHSSSQTFNLNAANLQPFFYHSSHWVIYYLHLHLQATSTQHQQDRSKPPQKQQHGPQGQAHSSCSMLPVGIISTKASAQGTVSTVASAPLLVRWSSCAHSRMYRMLGKTIQQSLLC